MKKSVKKLFSSLLAAALVLTGVSLPAATAHAEGEEYLVFLAYGGETSDGAWDLQYVSDTNPDNAGDIVGTTAMAKVGDTVTVGITLPTAPTHTWWMAPVIIAEGVSDLDVSVDKIVMDGVDITANVDLAAGDLWWYEDTGAYSKTEAIRIAGGYNEWGAKYFAESPTGFTSLEYTLTINGITFGGGNDGGEAVLSEESYPAFIAIGADITDGDWGFQYYGDGAADNAGDVVATNGELKTGETTTLTLEFPSPVVNTWFVAPCMIVDDSSAISAQSTFDVKVYLDDVEVAVDLAAGDLFWAEGTGPYPVEQCVRIAGGFNEWGTHYIEEPIGFSKITFEITPTIYVGGAAPAEEPTGSGLSVDLNGTYNAYLCFQTPKFSFRNAFDDATYGRDTDFFKQVTGWDDSNNAITHPGTFTDVVIAGNGTYTVSVEGLAFPSGEFDGQDYMNLIFLSTDIPNSGEITISDVKLTVDGKNVTLASVGAVVDEDKEYMEVGIQNIWGDDIKEIGFYTVPMTNMSITFTVSGFAYDAAPASTDAPSTDGNTAPAPSTAEPAEESGSNTGLIIGIVVAVVVVVAVAAGVVVSKKKKGNK